MLTHVRETQTQHARHAHVRLVVLQHLAQQSLAVRVRVVEEQREAQCQTRSDAVVAPSPAASEGTARECPPPVAPPSRRVLSLNLSIHIYRS